jgi:hypothetical protein
MSKFTIDAVAFECPRCRGKDFEIVKDEVDIGVGVQTRVLGGICAVCGDISLCDMCGGWDGRHEVWCELVPSLVKETT